MPLDPLTAGATAAATWRWEKYGKDVTDRAKGEIKARWKRFQKCGEGSSAHRLPLPYGERAGVRGVYQMEASMPSQTSKGKCEFCGGTFGKIAMKRHVMSCPQRQTALEAEARQRKPQTPRLFHLLVEGQYAPMYWLHLDVRADAKLKDLDKFLRDIWLECCGHLSAFTIEGQRYSISPIDELDEANMNATLSEVLAPGIKN